MTDEKCKVWGKTVFGGPPGARSGSMRRRLQAPPVPAKNCPQEKIRSTAFSV